MKLSDQKLFPQKRMSRIIQKSLNWIEDASIHTSHSVLSTLSDSFYFNQETEHSKTLKSFYQNFLSKQRNELNWRISKKDMLKTKTWYTQRSLREKFENPKESDNRIFLTVRDSDSNIIGTIDWKYNPSSKNFTIHYMLLDKENRDSGIWKQLLERLLDLVKEKFKDAETVTSYYSEDNVLSASIHRSLSFKTYWKPDPTFYWRWEGIFPWITVILTL